MDRICQETEKGCEPAKPDELQVFGKSKCWARGCTKEIWCTWNGALKENVIVNETDNETD